MGRPERPIDPKEDPLSEFAVELRRLRILAGSPSYRELARRSSYSKSVLSEAAGGRSLPTLEVTLAYVRACRGDVTRWQGRWRELAARQVPTELVADGGEGGSIVLTCPNCHRPITIVNELMVTR
jgi:hypothetical protein